MTEPRRIEAPPGDPADEAQLERAVRDFRRGVHRLCEEVSQVVAGQTHVIATVVAAMIAEGHVLLEGPPGLGKTLLARTIAAVTALQFDRVQCTPDLMSADVTGTNVLVPGEDGRQELVFRPGPIFAQVVLVDEINRAVPRTQSAMLEAMQERTVTIGGRTRALPRPFLVMATRNPHGDEGTYRLPEAQRDRFLVQVDVEHPPEDVLREIVDRTTGDVQKEPACPLAPNFLPAAAELAARVHVAGHLRRWVADLVTACDASSPTALASVADHLDVCPGPRGAQALLSMAKVGALAAGRTAIGRRHIRDVAQACLRHRMQCSPGALVRGLDEATLVRRLLDEVPVPLPKVAS